MATLKRKSPEFVGAPDATPTGPPAKKLRLTQGQKQALIDNLQLEITERARKLRSQYALQANDLRARIERRVNRIPVSLRKANMGELYEKHNAPNSTTSPLRRPSPAKAKTRVATNISVDPASPVGRNRRASHEGYSDKENAPNTGETDALKNPKRRNNPKAAGGASRVVSQEVRNNDHRILSPKSLNSRTYPHSPFRASPEKGQPSYLSRPTSPLKPSSPLRAAGAGARPRGATTSTFRDTLQPTQPKKTTARAATGPRAAVRSPLPRPATRQGERRNSNASTTSSSTTVQKPTRTATGARKPTTGTSTTTTTKKPAVPRNQAASLAVKKTAANAASVRKTTAPAATTEASGRGTRALRKRV
ncbi:hypothetical protein N7532_009888 [Penicillium argentinense]|uniref:Borealin N-terminal domain-containing protein n=1 Tax=Penicillium argentinense TaxID=1131581 RepID=A0A9W9ENL0_9EURO|nr:uncharacterized protein N7532_009888 [Penicillium argentinense]KAJ5085117.1 hypothetical protein N7532_009888 [Penicillium argentinense]